jgi:hypothetical protein
VNELVTNAVKYAFPDAARRTVVVTLKRVPGELRLDPALSCRSAMLARGMQSGFNNSTTIRQTRQSRLSARRIGLVVCDVISNGRAATREAPMAPFLLGVPLSVVPVSSLRVAKSDGALLEQGREQARQMQH